MSLLVTGHKGFVGQYFLHRSDVVGLVSPDTGLPVDLIDASSIQASLDAVSPDAVIHLAAQSSVPEAFSNPLSTYESNFIGTHNLLSALKRRSFKGRFLYVSTAEVYGQVTDEFLPVNESAAVSPLNPYAVSKLISETLCQYWARVEGMDLVIARPFNHIGPGQSPRFAIADFAKSVIEIQAGKKPPVLEVGDLDVTRDFTDVRDVINAYLLLLEKGERAHIYNVCSGTERHMAKAVEELAELAGIVIQTKKDPGRFRKISQRRSCGDSTLLRARTGWAPAISWQQSLSDILDDWKQKLIIAEIGL